MLSEQIWGDLGGLVWAAFPAVSWLVVKRRAAPCLGLLGFDLAYALWVNPMGLRDAQVGLVTTLILASLVWLSVVVVIDLALRVFTFKASHKALALAAVLGVLLWTRANRLLERAPQRELDAAADLADHLFADVPPGALMLASSDQRASSCIWLQAALGSRPDTRCVPIVFTRSAPILRQLARSQVGEGFGRAAGEARAAKSPAERAAVMAHWLRPALQSRPVLWQQGQAFEDAQVADYLLAGFPWDRLQISRPTDVSADVLKGLRQADVACARALHSHRCEPGNAVSANVASWAAIWGAWLLRRGRRSSAKASLEAAVHWGPKRATALNNLAVLRMQSDQPQQALVLCRRALRAQPDYLRAHRTASRAAVRSGDSAALVNHASKWLRYERRPSRWLDSLASQTSDPQMHRYIEQLRSSR
ncbi:MAG TPA: hypothetical protein DCQ06_11880 [Myxococcales bacterium]|nr:hypothetical protein [Myxococcales bacterium]